MNKAINSNKIFFFNSMKKKQKKKNIFNYWKRLNMKKKCLNMEKNITKKIFYQNSVSIKKRKKKKEKCSFTEKTKENKAENKNCKAKHFPIKNLLLHNRPLLEWFMLTKVEWLSVFVSLPTVQLSKKSH